MSDQLKNADVLTDPRPILFLHYGHGSFQVRAKIEDNPFLSREFIASVRNSYTSSFAQQELDGEYVGHGGITAKAFCVLTGEKVKSDTVDIVEPYLESDGAIWFRAICSGCVRTRIPATAVDIVVYEIPSDMLDAYKRANSI